MYVIKKINVDNEIYKSSNIINCTNEKISAALVYLDNAVRDFIREEYGRETSENIKIIDIHNFNQINEPIIDTVLLYRLVDDPHHIHVYQKKTIITVQNGWAWGTSEIATSQFKRTHIFELEEYQNFKVPSIEPRIEMISIGTSGIKIPKQMTMSPISDVINELKASPKFKKRYNTSFTTEENTHIISEKEKNIYTISEEEISEEEISEEEKNIYTISEEEKSEEEESN